MGGFEKTLASSANGKIKLTLVLSSENPDSYGYLC